MITEEMIKRINELAHKSKNEGLTPEEKEEQAFLRQEYIKGFRANMRAQLDQIRFVEKDGTVVKPKGVKVEIKEKLN
ncbi:MAG: DUF896 domain-containing protein [Clostridiales bacterium]|nr:DUF896 domain-containing protein [Clostridiales bacterium]MBQ3107326.1 DUF896 domain-containing protein [Bacillota bacterium]